MSILHGDGAPVRDILYEDIRLNIDPHTPSPVFQTSRGEVYEDAGGFVPMLFEAIINKDMLWAQDALASDVEGVTYRNVSVTGPEPTSLVKGLDAEHRIRGSSSRTCASTASPSATPSGPRSSSNSMPIR